MSIKEINGVFSTSSDISNNVSSTCSNTSCTAEKNNMKQFIIAVQEYNKTRSEETASLLSRYLQLLGVTLEYSTFDPRKNVVSEFFVSLHELLTNLDSRSNLIWAGITVLQQACKNPEAHKALINIYQFLPILSKILGDHLSRDKKRKLLTLMQELTYGINITWQTSHLDHLITTLIRWIQNKEEPITSLSLGVLLNLAYKNLPVIYILMRNVKTTQFFTLLMSMDNADVDIKVLKLLLIVEQINGDKPKVDMYKFIKSTFRTMVDAFNQKDVIRLRHIVEFFLDIQKQKDKMKAISTYENYLEDVSKILDAIENNKIPEDYRNTNAMECMSLLFEFLFHLIQQKIPDIERLHTRIITLTLGWVQTELICTKALGLLKIIVLHENSSAVLEPLATGLPVFLYILDNEDSHSFIQSDQCKKFGALLQLLRAIVKCETVRSKVLTTLKQESIYKILNCLVVTDDTFKSRDTFTNEIIELHVQTMALLHELSTHEDSWKRIYMHFLSQKKIHASLAQAFFINSPDIKEIIFEMARSPEFPVQNICKIMCDMQISIDFGSNSVPCNPQNTENLYYPIMSHVQNEQLDQALNKLKQAIATNQLSNMATSEVMELYEYKLTSMGHAERAAQASLEASNQHATHLQHRLAQMSTELNRLHQLLFHAQQTAEENQREAKMLHETNKDITTALTKSEIKFQEIEKNFESTKELSEEKTVKINELQNGLRDTIESKKQLSKKHEAQIEKNKMLLKAAEALEDRNQKFKKEVTEKNEVIANNKLQMEKYEMEIRQLELLRQQNEKMIAQKEKELCEANNEISENKKIIDAIMKLTTTRQQ